MSAAPIYQHPVRVGYADTDQGGIAHHSVYVRWLEEARVAFLREAGVDFRRMEIEENTSVVVTEVNLRYRSPAFFDDIIMIETDVKHLGRASMIFRYRVFRKDGDKETLLTTSEIKVACINLKKKRPMAFPEHFGVKVRATMPAQ